MINWAILDKIRWGDFSEEIKISMVLWKWSQVEKDFPIRCVILSKILIVLGQLWALSICWEAKTGIRPWKIFLKACNRHLDVIFLKKPRKLSKVPSYINFIDPSEYFIPTKPQKLLPLSDLAENYPQKTFLFLSKKFSLIKEWEIIINGS